MNIGFAMCGSFCTFSKVFPVVEALAEKHTVYPIFSFVSATTDSRFGKASEFLERAEEICGQTVIKTIAEAEPIGPKKLLDILVIAPCTGNTIAKLANSITDNAVTLAVKSHLRNRNPVVVAVSTNDALSGSARNIGTLLNTRNYYFVPMRQDDPVKKPTSLVADFQKIPETLELALKGQQIQPMIF